MKKKELEIILQKYIEDFNPKNPSLEQYNTPPNIAADVLFRAIVDISDKIVADLGCGNGILGIGAKLLGAERVHCVDIDPKAIDTAQRNANKLNLKIEFHLTDIEMFNEKVNTVVQNPPFGCQTRHTDRKFIKKAVEIADVVYSLHMAKTVEFIKKFCDIELGCKVEEVKMYKFPIKHTFEFHKKEVEFFDVVLLKIRRERR